MGLEAGDRLGPYEILSRIGSGGMGEVYKARDTRLDRIVALKVLPARLAERADLRQRFEREARTIASLNHPNICMLYDIGEQAGTHYLVMEFLEGETLEQRLQRGPLPLDQILRCGIEITDALDKAHRKGFTHRDIKPANIMLTKSGSKILDFGLAKLKEVTTQPAKLDSSMPTPPSGLTADGTILGTLQYMAPEQLEGKVDELDGRADLFSFGAVLYEMATGQKAFAGSSQASVIAKIMDFEPPPIASLQPMMPVALDRVVKRCLAKDRQERVQSALDLCHELKWIAEAMGEPPLEVAARPRRRARGRMGWILAGALLLSTVALAVSYFRQREETPAQAMRFAISTPGTRLILSPDGRLVAYVAPDSSGTELLWVRPVDSLAARPLPGTERPADPFWAPRSRNMGFFADGKLKRVEVSTGAVQTLADAALGRGGTWSRDGMIVFTRESNGGLAKVSETGGEVSTVTTLDTARGDLSHRFPRFLPDSRHFIFLVQSSKPENNGIYVGALDSTETRQLLNTEFRAAYDGAGYLLFVRDQRLMAQPFDAGRLELSGEPIPVAEDVNAGRGTGDADFSVSDTGVLAYTTTAVTNSQLYWFDRSGVRLGTIGAPAQYATIPSPQLSPDGKHLAVSRGPSGSEDIWILEVPDGTASRFTFDPSRENSPLWSPDGTKILFRSNQGGTVYDLYQKSSSGAGTEELVYHSDATKYPNDWSPDGRSILYSVPGKTTGSDLWVLPLGAGHKPFAFLQTPANENQGQFSPDGRWVAYTSDESGRDEVYIQSFPTPGSKRQVSTAGGVQPRWRRDGKELFYLASDRKLMAAPVRGEATLEVGVPAALFQTRLTYFGSAPPGNKQAYDVASDGKRFVLLQPDEAASPVTVVLNWTARLRR